MTDSYNILIRKLDEFIKKYYKNRLIKGGLYFATLLLMFYLFVNLFEYFGNFGILTRTIIFYTYLLLNLFILWRFVLISFLKLYKIGKLISDDYAAQIIGKHFTEVKDKLLNTLQLKQLAESQELRTQNYELIYASIDQKINELKPIPFTSAIDLKVNRKYLKYPLIPLLVIVVIFLTAPGFLTEPSARLINHSTYYEKKAPFSFNILNNNLEAIQQDDYRLNIKLTGDEIPDKAYIIIDNTKYQLDKENTIMFHYNFRSLQKDTKFELTAENITTKEFLLRVLPKPIVLNFSSELTYPKYIGKKDEVLDNTGDLIIPVGTKVNWKFYTKDTKNVILRFDNKTKVIDNKEAPMFSYSEVFLSNQSYSISMRNEFLKNKDSLVYSIVVIPDAYPSIDVEERRDSLYEKHYYFKGLARDDYGFSKLSFNYRKIDKNDTVNNKNKEESVAIPVDLTTNLQQFYHFFDLSKLSLNPGEELEYYFEVWDNDGISGSKSSRSQKKIYKEPTKEEIEKANNKNTEQLKNTLESSINEAKMIQEQAENLSRKFLQKKDIGWQEKKQIQDLLDRQKNLQNQMESIKNQNAEKNIKEEQYNAQQNQEILEKQQELQKLFENLMTDEMKKMFNEFQDLMKKFDKDKASDMLNKIKFSNEDIKKELNRTLQIMKQLEFEKKLQEAIDKLKELAQKEKSLSEETKNSDERKAKSEEQKAKDEELKNKQEQNNSDFKDVRKDIDDARQKNSELEQPNKLNNTDEKENSIQNEMQNSLNSLQNNSFKKATKSQQNASEQMSELAQEMQDMKDEMEQEQEGEDIDKLRGLLENLVRISFNQEANMQKLRKTMRADPQYIKIMNEQRNIRDGLKMIEDTLYAISKRQIKIKEFVNKKITEINRNVEKTLTSLSGSYTTYGEGESYKSVALVSQQYTMTAINDLALMISESIDQMNEDLAQKQSKSSCSKPGKKCKKPGSCNKPGSGKKQSAMSLRKMQQELNKKLEQLKSGMNPFGNSASQQQKMSEQLARYAAEQEAIRKQLEGMAEDFKNDKEGRNNLNNALKQMEQTETDLVNKLLSQETINRQKQILTRLLESEKAEQERETDKKRESTEAKNQNFSNPNKFLEYNKIKLSGDEMLKTSLPTLKPFYKNKVNEYFYKFEN